MNEKQLAGRARRMLIAAGAVMALGMGCDQSMDPAEDSPVDGFRKKPSAAGPLDVTFDGCQEFAGLYPVALDDVAGFVPEDYVIATGDGTTTIAVFRTVQCDALAFEDGDTGPVIISQVGISVVPPLGAGDINNYTVHYGTNNHRLAKDLKARGIDATFVNNLAFTYTPGPGGQGTYFIENKHGQFKHVIAGPASEPPASDPGIPYVANWWQQGAAGNVQMETTIDALFIGDGAQVQVTTPHNTVIAEILGGEVTAPPVFAIRGVIPHAVMHVAAVAL